MFNRSTAALALLALAMLAPIVLAPVMRAQPVRLVPCDTDSDCAAKNPHIGPDFMAGESGE